MQSYMSKGAYTRSVAKCIRKQKARIRRSVRDKEEQDRLIRELLAQFKQRRKIK